jgi:hypothetical protein
MLNSHNFWTGQKDSCPAKLRVDGIDYSCLYRAGHDGQHRHRQHLWEGEAVTCESTYTLYSGRIVPCLGLRGHTGAHEGYYHPSDTRPSHWFDEPEEETVTEVAKAADEQVGGEHYRQTSIQPWDVIDAWSLDFYAGNTLKYLYRAGRKGAKLEDLKKARHYLDKMIEIEEGE